MEVIFLSLPRQAYPVAVEISFHLGKAFVPWLPTSVEMGLFTGSGNTKMSCYGSSQEHVYLRSS